ncbi:hypothetical protein pb186bvf_005968 [Paramecium bursaria]
MNIYFLCFNLCSQLDHFNSNNIDTKRSTNNHMHKLLQQVKIQQLLQFQRFETLLYFLFKIRMV